MYESGRLANGPVEQTDEAASAARFPRVTYKVGGSIAIISVIPLIIMTVINYGRFQDAYRAEQRRLISQITEDVKHSLEFSLQERLAALTFVAHQNPVSELSNPDKLGRLLTDMKRAFGGFIDLEFIDPDGRPVSYVGPYYLIEESRADQQWYRELRLRNAQISEVFLGHRDTPHFVVAVWHENPEHQLYVLRATIDPEMINRQIPAVQGGSSGDIFLVNYAGILQTPSRFYGDVLQPCPLQASSKSDQTVVEEIEDNSGHLLLVGRAALKGSPFVVMTVNRPHQIESWLALRRNLIFFTALSVLLILLVVGSGTRFIAYRLKERNRRWVAKLHHLEYTNKMAAIGRLSAGVAHEINNPLAIIEENAGLLKDLVTMSNEPLPGSKVLGRVDSIMRSVERCSEITHRLLGFAKHMDVRRDRVNLELLVHEVLGFLRKEAEHRGILVSLDIPNDLPEVETGRGELQQVFLNIINNAFAAVDEGGKIHISMESVGKEGVVVHIVDNGMGIPEDVLKHIFEPFFTTKKGTGTGLGLSITYGIIENLGGKISVTSRVGEGTIFVIEIPIRRP